MSEPLELTIKDLVVGRINDAEMVLERIDALAKGILREADRIREDIAKAKSIILEHWGE